MEIHTKHPADDVRWLSPGEELRKDWNALFKLELYQLLSSQNIYLTERTTDREAIQTQVSGRYFLKNE